VILRCCRSACYLRCVGSARLCGLLPLYWILPALRFASAAFAFTVTSFYHLRCCYRVTHTPFVGLRCDVPVTADSTLRCHLITRSAFIVFVVALPVTVAVTILPSVLAPRYLPSRTVDLDSFGSGYVQVTFPVCFTFVDYVYLPVLLYTPFCHHLPLPLLRFDFRSHYVV